MSVGFLTPDARLRVLSDVGVVVPGAKLNAYVAGSLSTRKDTFSDVALTTPNANPVVASAGGLFGPIYLTKGVAYQFQLTDTLGAVLWTQDNVSVPADNTLAAGTGISLATVAGVTTITATAGLASIGGNDFRLTLESGVPVSATDQLAKTTLFCTPGGRGNRLDLYDAGGVPTAYASAQFSIAIPATVSQLYDVFCFANAGVPTLELLAWTNDTTRATPIVLTTTGTWTKSGDLTRRYLGCVRTTTVNGQTEDSLVKRYVWNVSNRVRRPLRRMETTASWTYSLAALHQANAAAANQVDLVVGVADVALHLDLAVHAANTTGTSIGVYIGIGQDSTAAVVAGQLGGEAYPPNVGIVGLRASLDLLPAVGRHFYPWLEYATATGTTTWYATNLATLTAGLSGFYEG